MYLRITKFIKINNLPVTDPVACLIDINYKLIIYISFR